MYWEKLFAFSDNPLEKEPSPLFNTTNTYILGDRQATDARTTEQYQQQQQNSINNNRTVSTYISLRFLRDPSNGRKGTSPRTA